MRQSPEDPVTLAELVQTIGRVRNALREHRNPTSEIQEVTAELSRIEQEFVAGLLPMTPLRAVLGVIAQFEYTPWRVSTVVEDLHKIWSLLGML